MVELGEKYKDNISGFEGTAIGRAVYLHGCEQVLLVADSEENAEPVSLWFDEQRLIDDSPAVAGGPQTAPPVRTAPK